jgi:aldehyde:ferredoxin oxidoreductase
MTYGFMGKILEVDLTSGKISERELPEEYFRKYLGGSGVAARILYDEFDYNVDPLSPENPIIFMNGLLTGIAVPTAAKSSFVTKSPLTDIWNESTVGGHWGEQVKKCGYDGIIITGKSEKPVYLWITDQKVEIRPADDLMGKDVFETSDAVKTQTDEKAVVACIGPAGENLCRIAGVMIGGNETRAAGRGGVGAVMGYKNLKAMAAKGHLSPQVKDREKLKELLKEFLPVLNTNAKGLHDFGTAGGVQGVEANGDLPIKNWTLGDWAEGAAKTCGQYMAEQGITVSHHACFSCSIRCGKDARVDVGPYAGSIGHGPEYETCAAFGANILNDDIRYLVAANDMCNRFGLDTICTGNSVAMAIECYENGLITKYDTGGLELTWGNGPAVLELIRKIAYREGIGDVFADGVVNAARRIGGIAEEFAVHVKGLSVAFHDPRAFTSMAANYATANRGACHLEGLTYFSESGAFPPSLLGFDKSLEKRSDDNKAELAINMQNFMNTFNALGLCKFLIRGKTSPADITGWINAVNGWELTGEELMVIGERLHNLKRMYNVRLGISRKDDKLPPRLMSHDKRTGAAAGILPHMGRLLSEYYSLRGWTQEGIPTKEKLAELGL